MSIATSDPDAGPSTMPAGPLEELRLEVQMLREAIEALAEAGPQPQVPAVRNFLPGTSIELVARFIRLHEARQQVVGPKLTFELETDDVDIISAIDRKLALLARQILVSTETLIEVRALGRLRDVTNCAVREAVAKRGLWETLEPFHLDASVVDHPGFAGRLEDLLGSLPAS